jgi:TRAP-type mannitol/chloroaromatic compound transport system permease large subunit
VAKGRLTFKLLTQALDSTARLSCFVLFILIGSTVFSFTFNSADGHIWVEHLFDNMPGGAMGFLIVVNILVFVLGMFIDFFEIAFIVVPILAPVADKILPELLPPGTPPEFALIWFGIILAMNLQTSFLTPPFGFALFYLRSVAARTDYKDRVTGETIPAVSTAQIYKGSIAFIILQLIMVAVVIAYPQLVSGNMEQVGTRSGSVGARPGCQWRRGRGEDRVQRRRSDEGPARRHGEGCQGEEVEAHREDNGLNEKGPALRGLSLSGAVRIETQSLADCM